VSAFDELQRQLIDSVAQRARVRRSAAALNLGRWWRGRLHADTMAVAMTALLIAIVLAVTLVSRVGARTQVAGLTASATFTAESGASSPCEPCRAVGGRLHAPLSEEGSEGGSSTSAGHDVRIKRGRPIVRWTASTELPSESEG
jgi:hypothetical protein